MTTDSQTTEPRPLPPSRQAGVFSAGAVVVAGLLLILLTLIIKSAWLGDDFYIGARSLDNFLNGHGLRWNVIERVQVFTAPFWFLGVTACYAITGEVFLTTIVLSVATSLAAVFIVVRYAATTWAAAAAGLAVLISSRAFLDYTTSGLENPLSYLLTALFCVAFSRGPIDRRMLQKLILLSALIGFNRLDLMLMLFPVVAFVAWTVWRNKIVTFGRLARDSVIFSLPLSLWLAFSIVYYGYPFPNTYYAKLSTGIPRGEQLVQGFLYYLSSLSADPVTLLVLGLAAAALLLSGKARFIAAGIGVVLYLGYVVKIGGDFMNGRFFSVPLFFALAFVVQLRLTWPTWSALGLLSLGAGVLAPRPTLFYNEHFSLPPEQFLDPRGVADERAAYYPEVGLMPVLRHDRFEPAHPWAQWGREARQQGRQLVIFGTPGMYAYYAGPDVHVIDYHCLGDPLLSKLPITAGMPWRVGHYARPIPDGYIASIQRGENVIKDPAVRQLYDVTALIARAPLFSGERWKAILKMNLGHYEPLIRAAAKSERSSAPPEHNALISYPWPEPHQRVNATISGSWGVESDGINTFAWADKDARVEFVVPEGGENQRPLIIPIERYGREVQLQFVANGQPLSPDSVKPITGSRFVRFVVRGPWQAGTNVVEIIGSGEAVQPPGGDPRHLLFAVGEPLWQ